MTGCDAARAACAKLRAGGEELAVRRRRSDQVDPEERPLLERHRRDPAQRRGGGDAGGQADGAAAAHRGLPRHRAGGRLDHVGLEACPRAQPQDGVVVAGAVERVDHRERPVGEVAQRERRARGEGVALGDRGDGGHAGAVRVHARERR